MSFWDLFKKAPPSPPPPSVHTMEVTGLGILRVVEGDSGVWFYHLAKVGEQASLCGDRHIMNSNMAVRDFGRTIEPGHHVPERHCSKCLAIYRDAKRPVETP